MRIGYFDCFAGVSGDMLLGALLDCGLPLDRLTDELAKLPVAGYHISSQTAKRGIISGTQVTVTVEDNTHTPRKLNDILQIIEQSSIPAGPKQRSAEVFKRLAEAESKVHRIKPNDVHFHEVGATDAIVDIVGTAIGIEILGIESLYCSPLPTGSGLVDTQHDLIPVPAPATLELIASARAPVRPTTHPDFGELVTPTGAALVTTLASFDTPTFTLDRVGYGVGRRNLKSLPNVLPLWLGEKTQPIRSLLRLDTNIDDMSPELCGHVMNRLFEHGALDVWFTPIQMKKNRPAVMLSALCPIEAEGVLVETIIRETSTLGVRAQRVDRHECERESIYFASSLGPVMVKVKRFQGEQLGVSPEYEDCRRLAETHRLPLQEVFRIVTAEAGSKLIKASNHITGRKEPQT